jgi:benzodiazapine receptor
MTTYIPSITIPANVLQHPAASILLPVALGTAVGYGTRRKPRRRKAMLSFKLTWVLC